MVDARYGRGGETCESIAERMDSISESTVWTSPTLHRPSVELRPPCVGKGRAMRPASSTVRRWRGALCGDSCGRSALSETTCFDSREQRCVDQREAPYAYTSRTVLRFTGALCVDRREAASGYTSRTVLRSTGALCVDHGKHRPATHPHPARSTGALCVDQREAPSGFRLHVPHRASIHLERCASINGATRY